MGLIYNHNAGNSWRRSVYAPTVASASRTGAGPRPAGSFNSSLVSSLNQLTESAPSNGSTAAAVSRSTMAQNLKPPTRGASPAVLSSGQRAGALKPPANLAYANYTSGQNVQAQSGGLSQINNSVNRAAARGQFAGINNRSVGQSGAARSVSSGRGDQQYYEKLAEQAAQRHGVDPNLVKAVITAESSYNPGVVSKAGAMGLMQLMPGTAKDMQVKNPFDPKQNIEGGTKYLAWLSKQFDGDENKILAAYNWGPGNVQRGGNMPSETRNYLVKVRQYKQEYQRLAARQEPRLAANSPSEAPSAQMSDKSVSKEAEKSV